MRTEGLRLIPAVDLRGGRCVRLLRGDFAAETAYPPRPEELLAKYRDLGADWLHLVDLDGARDGSAANRSVIRRLADQDAVRLQVGGGLRDRASVAEMLNLGVARVVVGSAAVTDVHSVSEWLCEFGRDRVILAFDVRIDAGGSPRVATHGWRRQSTLTLWNAVANYAGNEPQHVLCTDIGRDGALSGPNLELYREATSRFDGIEWQASGGVRDARDLRNLAATGAAAAISGTALLQELMPAEELRAFLPNA